MISARKKSSNKYFSLVYAYLTVYFKEDTFIESKRVELYGWTNFLANCGGSINNFMVESFIILYIFSGFLGLLMGGSLISLVEVLYHFILKPCMFEKKTRPVKTKDTEESEFSGVYKPTEN